MEWPACFADLNPTEKVWGTLTRRVYYNRKHYLNVKEFKEAIIEILRKEYLEQLVASTKSHQLTSRFL